MSTCFSSYGLRSLFSLKGEDRTKALCLWTLMIYTPFLGSHRTSVFSPLGSPRFHLNHGEVAQLPIRLPSFLLWLFYGLTGDSSCRFSIVSVCLFLIYACVSMILKLENGQQNVDLSSGNFL